MGSLVRHPLILLAIVSALSGAIGLVLFNGWAESWRHTISQALFPPPPLPVTDLRTLIFDQLEDQQALHTAKHTLTAIVTSEQERRLGRFYLGETVLVYQGVGYAQAAIDLRQIQITNVDRQNGSIRVILPPAYLASVELDVKQSGVLEEQRAWIAPNVETQLYAEAERAAVDQMRQAVCRNDVLFDRASTQAATLLREILTAARYTDVTIDTTNGDRQGCPAEP
jgi:hypothetical protein